MWSYKEMRWFRSGDIKFGMTLLDTSYSRGKCQWEYTVENLESGVEIAHGRELYTPFDDPEKAVQSLIGFLTSDDSEMFAENDWTHDSDELSGMLEYDDEASVYENVYIITEVRQDAT